MRAQLDAICFHLYGIACDDVDDVMSTSLIVKRKDLTAHGTYRTRDLVLGHYSA